MFQGSFTKPILKGGKPCQQKEKYMFMSVRVDSMANEHSNSTNDRIRINFTSLEQTSSALFVHTPDIVKEL